MQIEGTGLGTLLRYTGSGTAIKFGTSDSVLNPGCALRHCQLWIDNVAATGVLLNSTRSAELEDLYITGGNATPFDNARTSIGVDIDGRNISNFFNTIKDVYCAHVHTGFRVGTTGTTQATTTNFFNCIAFCDVATDDAGIGVHIGAATSIAQGDGGSWYGGDLESCATGLYCTQYAYPMSFVGVRFESNTVDILLDSGCPAMNFIGLVQFLATEVTDNSGNDQNFIGCTQSTLVTYNKIPRLMHTKPIENVIATNVITAAESGTTFYLNAAGGFTSTLPAAADGLHYTFILRTAPTTDYIVTTGGAVDVMNGFILDIVGELVPITGQDKFSFVASTSLVSDRLYVECDGSSWHCVAFSKADGGIVATTT